MMELEETWATQFKPAPLLPPQDQSVTHTLRRPLPRPPSPPSASAGPHSRVPTLVVQTTGTPASPSQYLLGKVLSYSTVVAWGRSCRVGLFCVVFVREWQEQKIERTR